MTVESEITEQTASQTQASQEQATEDVPQRMVPVGESIRYRKRAQAAEHELSELRQSVEAMQHQLDEAQQTVSQLERHQKVDALLAESKVVDLQVARLLTEAAIESMDQPDVELAIADLRRSKPYLFRRRTDQEISAMSARADVMTQPAEDAARQAVETGDRRDLLRYLRLRRS